MDSKIDIERRHFIASTLLASLSVSLAFALEGCGGGSGTAGGAGTQSTRGVVTLPPGSTLNPTQLSVDNAYASNPLNATGAFSAKAAASVPSLVVLRHNSDRGVMFGFVDPSVGSNTLDARAQAVALLYMAFGGYELPADHKRDLLKLIAGDPSIGPLADVISARIAANPFALEDGDPQVGSALQAAYSTLTGGKAAVPGTRAAAVTVSQAHGQAAARAAAVQPAALSRDASIPLQLLVDPSAQQSGVEVLQDSATTGLIVTNHYRRRCKVLVYATGTEDANGKRTDFAAAQLQGTPIDLGPTTALGIFSTLSNLFSGQTAFVPVSTPVIPLTMAPGATKTFFDIIVLGSANNQNGEPAFFSEASYANEVAGWRKMRSTLNLYSMLGDLTLGVLVEALGFVYAVPSETSIQASIDGLSDIGDPSVTELLVNAGRGDLVASFEGIITFLGGTNTSFNRKLRGELYKMLTIAQQQAAAQAAEAVSQRSLALILKLATRALAAASLVLGAGDIGALIHDLTVTNDADRWTATLFKPTLLLSPSTVTISHGARQTFTVKIPAGLQGTVVYDWSTTATFATLSDNAGKTGKSIETNTAIVDLVTSPSDQGTITVAVTAFLQGPQGGRVKIGDATATVTISSSTGTTTEPTEIQVIVAPSPSGAGSASRTAYGMYTFTPVSAALYYEPYITNPGGLQGPLGGRLYQSDYLAGVPAIDTSVDNSHWHAYGASGTTSGQFYNLGDKSIGYLALAESFDPSLVSDAQAMQDVTNAMKRNGTIVILITT